MDLSLTESQEMLRSAARSFVAREAPSHVIVALQRAASSLVPDLWRKAAELDAEPDPHVEQHADPQGGLARPR